MPPSAPVPGSFACCENTCGPIEILHPSASICCSSRRVNKAPVVRFSSANWLNCRVTLDSASLVVWRNLSNTPRGTRLPTSIPTTLLAIPRCIAIDSVARARVYASPTLASLGSKSPSSIATTSVARRSLSLGHRPTPRGREDRQGTTRPSIQWYSTLLVTPIWNSDWQKFSPLATVADVRRLLLRVDPRPRKSRPAAARRCLSTPVPRPVHSTESGPVAALPHLVGLHHEYMGRAA